MGDMPTLDELKVELRKLESLAPKIMDGNISPTQIIRMSNRARREYDTNMARRWEVEALVRELSRTPAEIAEDERRVTRKALESSLCGVESRLQMFQSWSSSGYRGGYSKKAFVAECTRLADERENLSKQLQELAQ